MQAPSEAPVLEEHQTGGPPFTHQQVCLCRSLSLYVCVHISRSSNIQYVSLIWTCNMFYMQVGQDENIVSGSIPSHAEVESQPQVLNLKYMLLIIFVDPLPPKVHVYFLTLAYLIFHICYFICRPLLMHRCLKSTKPAAHRSLTSRYVTVDRFLCTFVYTSQAQVTFNMYP